MKITFDIDCTPDEARRFLGLPDVAPLQEMMMAQMKAQVEKAATAMDPESVMKVLFPKMESLAEIQKVFWSHLAGNGNSKP